MRKSNGFSLETLEKRELMSASGLTWNMASTSTASGGTTVKLPFPVPTAIGLVGTASGTYLKHVANPDTGATYSLSGTGNVTPLGSDTVSGSLVTPGFVANGRITGTVTLNNSHGSVTASLSGAAPAAITATSAIKLTYVVTSATGRYKGTAGTGSVVVAFSPMKVAPPTAFGVTAGDFTLTFKAGVVALM